MQKTTLTLFAAATFLANSVWAQTTASSPAPVEKATSKAKKDKTVEKLRTEDSGSRIDETRMGGETQNITVQSKVADVPPYEVKPTENTPAAGPAGAGAGGKRLWNVHKF